MNACVIFTDAHPDMKPAKQIDSTTFQFMWQVQQVVPDFHCGDEQTDANADD